VAAMVVFENGRARKSLYRKYRLQTVFGQDDYACMHEVLKRRLGKKTASTPYPDLLMVDGGKGQLNIARAVIQELKLDGRFDLIGIAKKDEKKGETQDKIFKPARANPVSFGREQELLLFLQRIRDEAHRFAIGYHRQRRSKRSLQDF
jgi:excinuclease ABC subunit C